MSAHMDDYLAPHYINRSNWLRAAVLGANDGILSTASIAIGVASASVTRDPIVLATVAGLVAGALSMAAGEYVSVSSQTDVEKADILREKQELEEMPELELQRLAEIYEQRGLKKETAMLVAKELTEHDALGAHLIDELGLNEISWPILFKLRWHPVRLLLQGVYYHCWLHCFYPWNHCGILCMDLLLFFSSFSERWQLRLVGREY